MGRRSIHTPDELRELIIEATTAIVEQDGPKGLSARAIATTLRDAPGTPPPGAALGLANRWDEGGLRCTRLARAEGADRLMPPALIPPSVLVALVLLAPVLLPLLTAAIYLVAGWGRRTVWLSTGSAVVVLAAVITLAAQVSTSGPRTAAGGGRRGGAVDSGHRADTRGLGARARATRSAGGGLQSD